MQNLVSEILVTQPMQWAGVPDIGDVEALSEADRACFRAGHARKHYTRPGATS
jgi:hypothetical protein